ncbi:MAG: hypothetical protein AAF938_09510 [Myxococcota bacterium]
MISAPHARPALCALFAMLGLLVAAPALAAPTYRVEAHLEGDELRVETIIDDFDAEGEVRLWFYTDRVGAVPDAMNQQTARWVFPREIDLAPVRIERVEVDGSETPHTRLAGQGVRSRDVAGTDVVVTVGDGARQLRIVHRQRVPERFGRFGRVGERFTLAGPWYPLLLEGHDGFRVLGDHHVRFCTDETLDFADGGWVEREGCVERQLRGTFLPVMASEGYRRYAVEHATIISHRGLYREPEDRGGLTGLRDLGRARVIDSIEGVVRSVRQTLRAARVPLRGQPTVVLVPSRTELAAIAGDVVVVSDRIYELFPLEQIRALHDRALSRALFRWHLRDRSDGLEGPGDAPWADDLRAVLLTDLDLQRRHGEVLTPRELLGWAAFNPVIDQLLYAPQVAFSDTLFGVVDEPDAFRDDPARARYPFIRGRRLLEHARDRLSERELNRWSYALLRMQRPARTALARIAPEAPLADWLRAPTMPVNYRLGEVTTERRDDGAYVHRIEIVREGAARHEPVEVLVQARRGERATATWDGEGERGVVEVVTQRRRRSVVIDPRGRLPESAEVADGHPLRDNTDTLRFRPPIIQNFNVAFSTEGNFIGLIDLALRRRYDLENTLALNLNTGPRSRGGSLRYSRSFGRKRDTNSRVASFTSGIFADRLRSNFFSSGSDADNAGAWRTGFFLRATYNDQRYFIDPRAGFLVSGGIRGALVREDDGTRRYTITPSVRANVTVPIGLRTALVMVGAAAYVVGDPIATQLPGLAGRFGLRGYQTDELIGRGAGFAVAELRFTPTAFSDLSWNLAQVEWLREVQLAVFAGAGGVLDRRDSAELPYGIEAGAGVRLHIDHGGVQPGLVVIDAAFPLVRRGSSRPPVTFFFAFEQYL